ncbi:MAG TPA: hypothetical protein VEW47_16090 [Candidatus Dormibacteraeota bacterium]|nr:hypothetical protein [Candidatus Dormibacteraeota bacterium]
MIWVAFHDAATAERVTERREFRQHWPYHVRFPREACYLGWQESFALLGKLVEAEIRD